MSNSKIYFHIGTHKTGTTALQKFFVENSDILKKNGIIYQDYDENEMNQGYLVNPERWASVSFDKRRNYLISGEDFYSHILNMADFIKEALSGFDLHFIIYLKRQDLMKQSVYNQIVKAHGFWRSLQEDQHYNLDYFGFLNRLKESFKGSKITVRPYEKQQFFGGSIYSDFLRILGLELTDDYKIERGVINPSLSIEKLEFVRLINMLGLPVHFRNRLSRLVVNSALKANEVSLFRKQDLISPKHAQTLLQQYSEGNQQIAKEFLGREDGCLFYEDIKEDPDWKAFSGLRSEVAHKIFMDIQEMDREVLQELYKHISSTFEFGKDFSRAANILMPALIDVLGKAVPFVRFSQKGAENRFQELSSRLGSPAESADILREVALAFEESGDIRTACEIMGQALLLRPEGPFIRRKLEEFTRALATGDSLEGS